MLKSLKRLPRKARLTWRQFRDPDSIVLRGVRVGTARDDLPERVRSELFKGTYEGPECRLAIQTLEPGDRVLEIGTGIGLVSLLATRICGQGKVLSCEANAELEPLIRENFRLNGWRPNMEMRAVTKDGRDLEFFRDDNILSSSAFDRGRSAEKTVVRSVAINELIERHQPSVLIMDAEGSEVELLSSANLTAIRAIILEVHPTIVGMTEIEDMLESMARQGLWLHKSRVNSRLLLRKGWTHRSESRPPGGGPS